MPTAVNGYELYFLRGALRRKRRRKRRDQRRQYFRSCRTILSV